MATIVDDDTPLYDLRTGGPLPGAAFVALVPGERAPLLPLDLPDGLRGPARESVARRQVSDLLGLAGDEIELRPGHGGPDRGVWHSTMVVWTAEIATWRARFVGDAPHCLAILPDYLALPAASDTWVIHVAGNRVRARLGVVDGFSSEPELARLLLAKAPKPARILRLGDPVKALDDDLAALKIPLHTEAQAMSGENTAAPRAFAHGELRLDLAVDPQRALEGLLKGLVLWRLPVALALSALVIWTAGNLIATTDRQARAETLRRDIVVALHATLLPDAPVLDIRRQVSQALADRQREASNARAQTPPFELFRQVADIVASTDARVTRAGFTADTGLGITVTLADFARLDHLKAALETGGISVTVARSNVAETDGIEAELLLNTAPRPGQ